MTKIDNPGNETSSDATRDAWLRLQGNGPTKPPRQVSDKEKTA